MLDANTDFDDRNLSENEEVIEKTITYLQYHDPANANREYAVGLLNSMPPTLEELFMRYYNDSETARGEK